MVGEAEMGAVGCSRGRGRNSAWLAGRGLARAGLAGAVSGGVWPAAPVPGALRGSRSLVVVVARGAALLPYTVALFSLTLPSSSFCSTSAVLSLLESPDSRSCAAAGSAKARKTASRTGEARLIMRQSRTNPVTCDRILRDLRYRGFRRSRSR